MSNYVIAVRREARDRAPADLAEFLKGIDGLTIRGAANPARIQVEASPEAIEQARQKLGECCHIEAEIVHQKYSG